LSLARTQSGYCAAKQILPILHLRIAPLTKVQYPTTLWAYELITCDRHEDRKKKEVAMLFDGGFSFSNFLVDVLAVFVFVVWFWLLITVFSDLFRRHDISGWGKALWVIVLILIPYLGVFIYLITQGRGMAERNAQYAERARDELRRVVGFSAADEIQKLDGLKRSGTISEDEFRHLRAKLVQ